MLQKLNNYSFQTDFFEILRNKHSLDNMQIILVDGVFRLEYKKSVIEKISYPYKSLEDANSDILQFKILHNLFYKSTHRDMI